MANEGKLTAEEMQRAQTWLNGAWTTARCPYSGHTVWEIGDVLVGTTGFQPGGGLLVGGPTYPLLTVMCSGCGHTVFVNAIKAGVVAADGTSLEAPAQLPGPPA